MIVLLISNYFTVKNFCVQCCAFFLKSDRPRCLRSDGVSVAFKYFHTFLHKKSEIHFYGYGAKKMFTKFRKTFQRTYRGKKKFIQNFDRLYKNSRQFPFE